MLSFQQVDYIKKEKFGGVMVWSLDLDDFSGTICDSHIKYPLMKTIINALQDDQWVSHMQHVYTYK